MLVPAACPGSWCCPLVVEVTHNCMPMQSSMHSSSLIKAFDGQGTPDFRAHNPSGST